MNTLFDIGMATGPVLGYVHQYFLIKMDQSVGTFSIDICGILLFANILRLNFYIFNQYEIALFFQSLIMIAAQICLIHICTKYAHKKTEVSLESPNNNNRTYNQSREETFWRWTQFSSYLCFILAFAFVTFSLSIICKKLQFQTYGVFVGLVALLSESLLIMPQILQNYKSRSTKGLSRVLVVLNLSGDILKLIYFLIKSQAFQFIMCGVIQVILDSYVVVQIIYYNRRQNKSLVLQKRKSSPQKTESINVLQEVQMKSIEDISPDVQENVDLESDQIEESPENEKRDKTPRNNEEYEEYVDEDSGEQGSGQNERKENNEPESLQKIQMN